MIKAILFDLDGTLLPMNEEEFTKGYFGLLYKNIMPYGYEKDKFISTVLKGTYAMRKNDGKFANEEVFWKCYSDVYGEESLKDKAVFDKFYETDFAKTKIFCGFNEKAKDVVKYCKDKGYKIILASNPLFPKETMEWRIKFAGIDPRDFDYISDYANSSYSKPNPMFLKEILEKNNLNAEDVVYFGNSEIEDGRPAKELGIKVYMVGDDIVVDKDNQNQFEHIKFEDIIKVV